MKKMTTLVLALLMLVGCFTGCLGESTATYTKDSFSITMDDQFYEKEMLAYTYYLESPDAIMTALKEEFTLFEQIGLSASDISLKDYAELVILANSADTSDVTEEDGLTYFTYQAEATGKTFYYMCFVYKGTDAFWSVNLACLADAKDDFTPTFMEWAKTVTVG